MATATSDSDVEQDHGNEGEGDGKGVPETHQSQKDRPEEPRSQENRPEDPRAQVNRQGDPNRRPPQTSQSRTQTERTIRITETQTESIQGLDDLSSCINSVDDHVQAGLQELRNCVSNLRKERTEMSEKVRTLTEEVHQVSSERNQYQLAIGELQQEVSILREQLCNQQQDKEALMRRMQEMQQRDENHLVNIAGKQRSRRLAHNAIVRWRRKTLDKGLGCREHLRLLEEENNQLRAELLLCQEAAKQAFLRSANALNSEAITMFQDAATRRLGFEETSSQGSQASQGPSPPSSPGRHPRTSQEKSGVGAGAESDKENRYKYDRGTGTGGWRRDTDGRERPGNEGICESDDNRSYIATYGSDDQGHVNTCHGSHHSAADVHQRTRVNYGGGEGYGAYGYESDAHQPPGLRPYPHSSTSEDLGAVGGRVPPQNRPPNVSEFEPDALQQETRAYLQLLRDERRRRPDPTLATGESQRKTQKTAPSYPDPKRRACSCRSRSTAADVQVPYKCPYCTPIQNSSFGHAKDVYKKASNVTRNTILSSTNTDKKKVLYKPSASTVVIEKHITR